MKLDSFNLPTHHIKIVLTGPMGSGKTSVMSRYLLHMYTRRSESTLGASFMSKKVSEDGVDFYLELWDTAGQERFRSLLPLYYREADVIIIMFDTSRKNAIDELQRDRWLEEITSLFRGKKSPLIYVVGNKIDLHKESREMGIVNRIERCEYDKYVEYVQGIGASLHLTSAKSGEGIEMLFQYILKDCSRESRYTTRSPRNYSEIVTVHTPRGKSNRSNKSSKSDSWNCCVLS